MKNLKHPDLVLLALLSEAINRTAYHGGLGMAEAGKYLDLIDRIIEAHDTTVEELLSLCSETPPPPP